MSYKELVVALVVLTKSDRAQRHRLLFHLFSDDGDVVVTAKLLERLRAAQQPVSKALQRAIASTDKLGPTQFPAWLESVKSEIPVAVGSLHGFSMGRFGIREPAGGEAVEPGGIDLVLVPGVAFSRAGVRVGRGAGFYDRFLAGTPATRVGVCFREQIVECAKGEAHDVPMDAIVTDGGDMIVVTENPARSGG